MTTRIILDSKTLDAKAINDEYGNIPGVTLVEENVKPSTTRGAETTIITAIVSSVLGFIVSVLNIAKAKGQKEIVIVGKSGWQVKLPVSVPYEEVVNYINAAKEADIESVTV